MERKVVIKWLKIFSISFLILSVIGVIDLILLSSIINLFLEGQYFTILTLIFQSSLMSFHAMLIWIILLVIFCGFIGFSFAIFKVANDNTVKDKILAKFLLLIGLFLIIGGFITMNFVVLLGKTTINSVPTPIAFEIALYSPSVTPVIGAIMWRYFTFLISCFLVSGMIFGGIGLKWMLLIQEKENSN